MGVLSSRSSGHISKIHLLQWVTAGTAASYQSCAKPAGDQTQKLRKKGFCCKAQVHAVHLIISGSHVYFAHFGPKHIMVVFFNCFLYN